MNNAIINYDRILRNHLELCEQCYAILQEENAFLKHQKMPTPEYLLTRKQDLLGDLEMSNQALKQMNRSSPLSSSCKAMAQSAQKKIMKILLLDRENEQLLLKFSVRSQLYSAALPKTAGASQKEVMRAYQ